MAVYFITGKLGSGKTLVSVGIIQKYLTQGRAVATNLDINMDKIVPKKNKSTLYRLPDKPRTTDLELIGLGSELVDESTYGALVLDECATWLNSRTWNDKDRTNFVDWMLHARKLGWDVYFIIQNIDIVDKQLRLMLGEHLVVCRRLDRLKIPFLTSFIKLVTGVRVTMPKVHTAKVHYGDTEQGLVADRWTYQGKNLYDAYDTRQAFTDNIEIHKDEEVDMRATYSLLSHWHLVGRYRKAPLFPIPKSIVEILIYPTWVLICLIRYFAGNTPARSVGV